MSLNKVMLIGNVGRDPEVRYLEGGPQGGQGRKVATFTLATTERYRDRSGEQRENTEWHNIVAWGQPADVAEKFIRKGSQIYIEGKLRTRAWTDQTGGKRYTTEVNVDNLQLLGRREGGQDGYQGGGYQGGQNPGYQGGQPQYRQSAPAQPYPGPAYQAPVSSPAPAAAPAVSDPAEEDDLPF